MKASCRFVVAEVLAAVVADELSVVVAAVDSAVEAEVPELAEEVLESSEMSEDRPFSKLDPARPVAAVAVVEDDDASCVPTAWKSVYMKLAMSPCTLLVCVPESSWLPSVLV